MQGMVAATAHHFRIFDAESSLKLTALLAAQGSFLKIDKISAGRLIPTGAIQSGATGLPLRIDTPALAYQRSP
jgi:hypothetical protein